MRKTDGVSIVALLGLSIFLAGCQSGDKDCCDSAGSACCSPEAAAPVLPPDPVTADIVGMKNARTVGDDLIGALPPEATLKQLAAAGYKTVVDTRGVKEATWDEKAVVEGLGMKYVTIPMPYPVVISDAQVEAFDAVMRTAERPLVLHCASGNRVAGLWAIWLAERKAVPPEDAIAFAAKAGMTRVRSLVEKRLGVTP